MANPYLCNAPPLKSGKRKIQSNLNLFRVINLFLRTKNLIFSWNLSHCFLSFKVSNEVELFKVLTILCSGKCTQENVLIDIKCSRSMPFYIWDIRLFVRSNNILNNLLLMLLGAPVGWFLNSRDQIAEQFNLNLHNCCNLSKSKMPDNETKSLIHAVYGL